jgi:hypothetical protein
MWSVVDVVALLLYGALWIGIGALVRKYPETIAGINTMPKQERERLDLPKIGRFLSGWMRASAVVIFLSLLIPKPELRWQVACWMPCLFTMLAVGYFIKYKKSRFQREGEDK